METTIRGEVNLILNEIKAKRDQMTPMSAGDKLMELTVYHSSLTAQISDLQFKYNQKLAELIQGDEKLPISKATIIAEATKEFKLLDEAIRFEKTLIQVLQSLKLWIRTRQSEMTYSNNI